MALSVNWITKVVFVPKADLTLVQSMPTEIRSHDLNAFRLELKSIEASDEGIPFLDIHQHQPPVLVGGVELARVVEIINGYTIEYEDGLYAVNQIGANSNAGDVVVVNQVSVRTSNSAGLVTSAAIEFGEYEGTVHVNQVTGAEGSIYPIGTLRMPVKNVSDAMIIAQARGFSKIQFLNPSVTLDTGDNIQNMIVMGINPTLTTITINPGANVSQCSFKDATIQGTLDGDSTLEKCSIVDLNYVNGEIHDCTFKGTITLGGGAQAHIVNCSSGIAGSGTPSIDFGGSGQALSMRGYSGGIALRNKTGVDNCSIDMESGQIIVESTVTSGDLFLRGAYKLTNNSTGTTSLSTDARIAVVEIADLFKASVSGGGGGGSTVQTSLSQERIDEIYELLKLVYTDVQNTNYNIIGAEGGRGNNELHEHDKKSTSRRKFR